jgi:hypothetical protein
MIRQLHSEWIRGRGRPVEKFDGAFALLLGTIPLIMIARTAGSPCCGPAR